jgi:alpha-glucosidase/alpha-D-xyloside xylohydrolase
MTGVAKRFGRIGALLVFALVGPYAYGDPTSIQFRDAAAELTIQEVGDRTVKVTISPIDEDTGEPRSEPESAVFVEQKPKTLFRGRALDGNQRFELAKMHVAVQPDPLAITLQRPNGDVVQVLKLNGDLSFHARQPVLGMGEGAQQLDRRGARYTMRDGWGAWERPILGSWVAVPLVIGTDGWALFVHHPLGGFDLREPEAKFSPRLGQSDVPLVLYATIWDEPADVLGEYARLTGPAPLPPKWALGYMQSHRTLAGPEEVLGVARTLRDKRLPCDALIYLGTGYCPAGWNTGHASVEFNPATFDKPAEMIESLHEQNFHVVLHQNAPPRQLTGNEVKHLEVDPEALRARPNRATSDISEYWARHRKTFALGVDGWWPDDGDELRRESRIARHRIYYEGPLLDRPNVRPWSLHRTGYAGVQRYGGWIWSGDIDSTWRTLAAQVSVGQNHSLSLSPYWGTDIGGFYPTRELTGELYVRWFQFGTFCPSYRAHGRTWHLRLPWGWNTGELGPDEHNRSVDLDELHNPDVEPICRKYLELRYQLLPYTYTLCREAHDTGLPLMRALWLHYPDDEAAITRGDEYLWGRDILVAPVTERGASTRDVYLPHDDWYDYWTGEKLAGGRVVARQVDLATMPLYVRAGTILPFDPVRQHTNAPIDELTTLKIYTGRDGTFRWYEDDGASLDYQRGQFLWTRLQWNDNERRLSIESDGGEIESEPRRFLVELIPSGELKEIQYNGRSTDVRF